MIQHRSQISDLRLTLECDNLASVCYSGRSIDERLAAFQRRYGHRQGSSLKKATAGRRTPKFEIHTVLCR